MSQTDQLAAELKDQPENPLRPNQAEFYRTEIDRLHGVVNAPPWVDGVDRAAASRELRRVQGLVDTQSAKPISDPAKRDRIAKLANEVMANEIQPALLPRAQMWRNPAGAVDAFRRQENGPRTKRSILTWKRALRALEPTNDEVDYTNVERFRPEGHVAGYMENARIPGNFGMSALAKDNWPLGEPLSTTALAEVKAREDAEADAERLDAARQRTQAAREALAAKRAEGAR